MASVAVPTLCAVCGEMQPSRLACLVHRKTCRVRFPCGQCAETFESKKKLAEHQKAHRVAHVCDMCETAPFCSRDRLEEHQWLEHKVPIKCPICEKVFSRTDDRARHVMHGDGPPTCACGKTFTRGDNMIEHMKKCTMIGPSLACECGARFQAMDAFLGHQDGCILSRCGAAKAVKRRFEEIVADDRAGSAVQALEEVASAARGQLRLTCAGCGGPFGNADSLARHKRKFAH